MKVFRGLGIAVLTMLAWSVLASAQFTPGSWQGINNAPPSAVAHAMMLSDGSVLVNSFFFQTHVDKWYRLIPDNTGSYLNGKWVAAGSLPSGYNPLYFASSMLPSGQVVIVGGEYNNGGSSWTTLGASYNPAGNKWTSLAAPTGWTSVGDAQSVILPNGKFMLANCCTKQQAILSSLNPVTWASTGTGKFDENDEEGWTLLPDGNVLTVDAYVNQYNPKGMNSEIYNTSTGSWSSAGSTVVQLWDSCRNTQSYEVGPAVLRPDGTVFATGANGCGAGHTAIYNTATATWAAGPDFPGTLDISDGPAALLPDGNVLLDTSPGIFQTGDQFFEFDGTNLNSVPGPPNSGIDSSYVSSLVVLPTGQVLFTDFTSNVQIYTPVGTACSSCAPTITSVSSTLTHGSKNNLIKGMQLNGVSAASTYGDDNQSASNFPLVRITDSASHVVYCRTHSFSTMGVATGTKPVAARFDIPPAIATGPATLEVVTNGIASAAVSVTIN